MSAVLEAALDAERHADCVRNDSVMAAELRALAGSIATRTHAAQLRRAAASPRLGPPAPDWLCRPAPASDYGRSCILCGGTPSGESHRGRIGRCTCKGLA